MTILNYVIKLILPTFSAISENMVNPFIYEYYFLQNTLLAFFDKDFKKNDRTVPLHFNLIVPKLPSFENSS